MRNVNRSAVMLALIGGLFLYWCMFPDKEPPLASANGVYANDCCGQVKLHDGLMTFNKDQYVSYVVGHDKVGRYILPASFVGITGANLIYRRDGVGSKLYLSDESQPRGLNLVNDETGDVTFHRSNGS